VFDGNEFIIDNLGAGSVLGHRCILTDEDMMVEVRTTEPTSISELTIFDFYEI
jgi:CRP-like cAMP-binding protein